MLGKGTTAAVCADPGCEPETAWVEECVSSFRDDGRGWYRSGVLALGVFLYCWCVTACVLGEGVEMSSWLSDGHSLFYFSSHRRERF